MTRYPIDDSLMTRSPGPRGYVSYFIRISPSLNTCNSVLFLVSGNPLRAQRLRGPRGPAGHCAHQPPGRFSEGARKWRARPSFKAFVRPAVMMARSFET